MHTFANKGDLYEMLHYAAFHQGLHCLLRKELSSEKETTILLEIITCDPSIYTMDHPKDCSKPEEESISA